MHEAEDEDLRNYKNLSQFFRRQLKPDARLLDISSPLVKFKEDMNIFHAGYLCVLHSSPILSN